MKNRMMKTIVAMAMVLVLTMMCIPMVSAIDYGGDCGEGLEWRYTEETGELKIEGNGSMPEYEYREVPWIDFVDDIIKVTVCEGVEYVSDEAFSCLESLEEISLPSTVDGVSVGFIHNNNCKKITVAEGNQYLSSDENGVLYDKNKTTLMIYPSGSETTEFTVPASVKEISNEAFFCAYKLKSVTLPDGLIRIGERAFFKTELLEKIEIPDSVIEIGHAAFEDSGIKSVKISSSLTKLAASVFASCVNLIEVTIPDSVKVIENDVFWDCESLKTVAIPMSVTHIDASAFEDCAAEINYAGSQEDWNKIVILDEDGVGKDVFNSLKVNYNVKTETQTTLAQTTEPASDDTTVQQNDGVDSKTVIIVAIIAVSVVVIIAIIAIIFVSKNKNKNKEYKTK